MYIHQDFRPWRKDNNWLLKTFHAMQKKLMSEHDECGRETFYALVMATLLLAL